jgi:translation initiation factor IF-3
MNRHIVEASPEHRRYFIRARKKFFREPPLPAEHRMNEEIHLTPVRVFDPGGEQIGVLYTDEATRIAGERDLDLFEIAHDAGPSVCKIMDDRKFIFERGKRAKESKRRQQQIEIKEVKLQLNIADHNFATKMRREKDFLSPGFHVKLTVMFRLGELRRPVNGCRPLHRSTGEVADIAAFGNPSPQWLHGRDLSMVVRPAG